MPSFDLFLILNGLLLTNYLDRWSIQYGFSNTRGCNWLRSFAFSGWRIIAISPTSLLFHYLSIEKEQQPTAFAVNFFFSIPTLPLNLLLPMIPSIKILFSCVSLFLLFT
ncbi:hypothetical protein ACH5RR_024309 [Cinchona calisaya]|uniref:Uncharacterized protein n=1 Tax=Cinchona calisaya TaxID=153742 RepID=A0ABD2Z0G3_9GENT